MVSKKRLLFIGIGVTALIAAACGGDDDTPTRVSPTATSVPGATATPTATSVPGATATPVPADTATPAPTGPRGTLTLVQAALGGENYIPRFNLAGEEGFLWDAIAIPSIGVNRTDGQSYDFAVGSAKSVDVVVTDTDVTITVVLKEVPFNENQGIISAEDLKFSLSQFLQEDSRNPRSRDIQNLLNRNADETVEIVDRQTLIIRSKKEYGVGPLIEGKAFHPVLGGPDATTIVPKRYFEEIGGELEFRKHPISNGPFRFVSHDANLRVVLEAVQNHWLKTPGFDQVRFEKVPEEATRIAALLSGNADAAVISPKSKDELDSSKAKIVRIQQSGEVFGIFGGMFLPTRDTYNPNTPWLGPDPLDENSVKVRHAMNIAIDREAIIEKVLFGEADPVAVPWLFDVAGAPWHSDRWVPYEYDPEKAKQLLAEAGYPNGFETNAFDVPLAYYPANADVMQVLAGFWRDIGITINETTVEYRPTLRTKLVDGTTDNLLYTYTQPLIYSPFIYFGASCCFTSGGVLYHLATEFIDDKWKNEANKEYDAIKQGAIMREIGDYIYDNYIGVPIAATRTLIAVNVDTVGEWQPSPGRSFIHDVAWAEPK